MTAGFLKPQTDEPAKHDSSQLRIAALLTPPLQWLFELQAGKKQAGKEVASREDLVQESCGKARPAQQSRGELAQHDH
jgi:hypothetical protein